MKNDSLILHIRLTKKCNASCDYCSSYKESLEQTMSLEDFKKSIDYLSKLIQEKKIGGSRKNLTIQYVGGELLTIKHGLLQGCVDYVRDTISPLFDFSRDGAQTNLIGSRQRVDDLINIFGADCIGTSIDSFTEQRKVGGSSKKYRTILLKNQVDFKHKHGSFAPGIFVVDRLSLPNLVTEIDIANSKGYHITLRPVFEGGSPGIHQSSINKLIPAYREAFKKWVLRQNILVQPFYQLLASRLGEKFQQYSDYYTYNTGCPFQNDCTHRSLDLEPNGDIYICLDMADSGQLKLGNAISGHFDDNLWDRISKRNEHLDDSCKKCPYLLSCQGGCMSEAIHSHGDPFGKTEYCELWKSLFHEVDMVINNEPAEKIVHWLKFIEKRHTPISDLKNSIM